MYRVTKQFKFCAAHLLLGYDGLCSNIHGHNYLVELTVAGRIPDNLGMVMDFSFLKQSMNGFLSEWDHALILNRNTPAVPEFAEKMGFKLVLIDGNPTAENMAKIIFRAMFDAYDVERVRVWETDTSYADFVKE